MNKKRKGGNTWRAELLANLEKEKRGVRKKGMRKNEVKWWKVVPGFGSKARGEAVHGGDEVEESFRWKRRRGEGGNREERSIWMAATNWNRA